MARNPGEARAVAEEWAERCAPLLSMRDWATVHAALGELHDQLREDIPDEAEFALVFADLVSGIIRRLGDAPVQSLSQAHVYACSGEDDHRALADAWLHRH
jgi:hypothetical protein